MRKNMILPATLISLVFISCAQEPDDTAKTAATSTTPAAAKPAHQPGLDLAGMDTTVHPGDDFFRYANGNWLAKTEIPADRSNYGVFAMLSEEANKRTAELIQNAGSSNGAAGSEPRMVGDFYTAFMDEKAIESRGIAPLKPELDAISALTDKVSLSRLLGSQMRADVDALNSTDLYTDRVFGIWVSPDFNDPKKNVAYMLQGGLGMPDRENYRALGEKDKELQGKYRQHIVDVLELAAIADAEAKATRIYDLEKKIADSHASRTDTSDVLKANNPWKLSEFPTKAPGMDWPAFFGAASLSDQPMIMVWQPSAAKGIAALVGSQPLDVWKDYLTFRALDRSSNLLSSQFVDQRFKFYGTALTGAEKQRDRWKRAVDATNGALGEAVGKMYADKYFPPEAKAAAQEMVKNIIAAFAQRVDKLEWMSAATKEKARAKVGTLYVGIGYPDKWRDYSGLEVRRDDAYGNAERAEAFHYKHVIARLGQPVDKTLWWMTPQTVNAVNLPLQNAMNFPAAILSPPFFDAATDAAQNYGGIGTVIGHEISHSFDDQGSQFDAEGRLNNWWSPEDLAHFQSASAKLVAQYGAYEPLPGQHLNGKLTLGENIADVAGIAAAYDGLKLSQAGKPAADVQGFTPDQRFFISFAQVWKSKYREQAMRNALLTNGHSPGEFRSATVRNVDAWYEAFKVTPDRKLYLPTEARVRIW